MRKIMILAILLTQVCLGLVKGQSPLTGTWYCGGDLNRKCNIDIERKKIQSFGAGEEDILVKDNGKQIFIIVPAWHLGNGIEISGLIDGPTISWSNSTVWTKGIVVNPDDLSKINDSVKAIHDKDKVITDNNRQAYEKLVAIKNTAANFFELEQIRNQGGLTGNVPDKRYERMSYIQVVAKIPVGKQANLSIDFGDKKNAPSKIILVYDFETQKLIKRFFHRYPQQEESLADQLVKNVGLLETQRKGEIVESCPRKIEYQFEPTKKEQRIVVVGEAYSNMHANYVPMFFETKSQAYKVTAMFEDGSDLAFDDTTIQVIIN